MIHGIFVEVFWDGKSSTIYIRPIICGILDTYNLDEDSHVCPTVVCGV